LVYVGVPELQSKITDPGIGFQVLGQAHAFHLILKPDFIYIFNEITFVFRSSDTIPFEDKRAAKIFHACLDFGKIF
jgi:hypothetical protein